MIAPLLFVMTVVAASLIMPNVWDVDVPLAWIMPEFVIFAEPLFPAPPLANMAMLPLPPVCWMVPAFIRLRLPAPIAAPPAPELVMVAFRLLVMVTTPSPETAAAPAPLLD